MSWAVFATGQLRARLILRHLLTAREPQGPTNITQAPLRWDSLEGASGMLAFPAGKCPAMPELKIGGPFCCKPDHPPPGVFATLQGRGVRISLMSSSLSQRPKGKSHQLQGAVGWEAVGSSSGKLRAFPELSNFIRLTTSRSHFLPFSDACVSTVTPL